MFNVVNLAHTPPKLQLASMVRTKKFFMQVSLLILEKEFVTSEVFDVYVEPLIQEFLQLWGRVLAYDVTCDVESRAFYLHTILI